MDYTNRYNNMRTVAFVYLRHDSRHIIVKDGGIAGGIHRLPRGHVTVDKKVNETYRGDTIMVTARASVFRKAAKPFTEGLDEEEEKKNDQMP